MIIFLYKGVLIVKIADTLMGFAKYELKEYPFIFENGILQLLPS